MAPRGENRTKLVEAMRALSLVKGYPATTVDEVCAEAEVSKGSFYHHFDAKEDIGYAALDAYYDELVAALTAGDFNDTQDPAERLRGFLAHSGVVCAGPLMAHGCLLGSFALDLAETHPDMQRKLSAQFDALAGFVAELIDEAAAASDIELASAALSRQFLAVIEGSIVLAKAHADRRILDSGLALFAQHIDLLLQQRVSAP